jgi:hypothetical protein
VHCDLRRVAWGDGRENACCSPPSAPIGRHTIAWIGSAASDRYFPNLIGQKELCAYACLRCAGTGLSASSANGSACRPCRPGRWRSYCALTCAGCGSVPSPSSAWAKIRGTGTNDVYARPNPTLHAAHRHGIEWAHSRLDCWRAHWRRWPHPKPHRWHYWRVRRGRLGPV